ncbi:MAG: hypothetical protein KBF21_06470 [Thermoanaerobaculia bacterium]|nr:hypothetical protein [Thermoanaerobaculia bacterium]MBP9823850.1 hypothetical protein [Thermoanaerobaculia bacterium]
MTLRVGITGVGVLSALGDEPAAVSRALCAGEHARRPLHPPAGADPTANGGFAGLDELEDAEIAPLRDFDAARYLGTETNLRPLDGAGRRLAAAAALALEASGWTAEACAAEAVGLVAGTMFAGMRTIAEFDRRALEAGPQYVMPLDFANTVFNAAAGQTAIRHRLTGPNATLGGGPVAALQALGYAADLVRAGQARAVLAGGVDELSAEALRAFSRAGLLSGAGEGPGVPVPFDGRRDGCALGEGAVLFMVESIADAERRGAPVLAEIVASASAWAPVREPGRAEPAEAPDEVAAALARTIAQVLGRRGTAAWALDAWSSSASGDVGRDRTEARGFTEALGEGARAVAVTAVKGALGEMLGAAGGLQALVLIEGMRSGRLPGIAGLATPDSDLGITLSAEGRAVDLRLGLATAVGFDGAVEALLLRRWEGEHFATR